MPLVSIVVPVYKAERFLHRCIDSILSQSFSDFELILVDDGSPDACGSICDAYAEKDSRIHVIHQKNLGQASARNAAIDWAFANSDSRWITFVDSDDWIHSKYLEVLLNALHRYGVRIACCKHRKVSVSETEPPQCTIPEPALVPAEDAYDTGACFKLYARELFSEVRFPAGRLYEDAATNYKVFFLDPYAAVVDAELYYYTMNDQGTTHSTWNPRKLEEFQALEEQLNFIKTLSKPQFTAKTVRIYLYAIIGQLNAIQNNKNSIPKSNYYLHLVRNKMRKVIRAHKKQADLTIKKYPQFYEYAYPSFMKIYWTFKSLSKKARSLLQHR